MGWTGIHATHYRNGSIDRKAEMHARIFERWPGYECVAESLVGSVYYAAVRKQETQEVFAVICLIRTDANDYYNFTYKDLDETMGPGEYKCPQKILKALTPTDSEWANVWRKKCWEWHKSRQSPTAFKNLAEGTEIEWIVPYEGYGHLHTGDRVRLRKEKLNPYNTRSPYVWKSVHDIPRFYLRSTNIHEGDFEVVDELCRSI